MFLRLNRKDGTTNIFNLDSVMSIWIDEEKVKIRFTHEESFTFYKKTHSAEYESLKIYFENKLEAYTIPNS